MFSPVSLRSILLGTTAMLVLAGAARAQAPAPDATPAPAAPAAPATPPAVTAPADTTPATPAPAPRVPTIADDKNRVHNIRASGVSPVRMLILQQDYYLMRVINSWILL